MCPTDSTGTVSVITKLHCFFFVSKFEYIVLNLNFCKTEVGADENVGQIFFKFNVFIPGKGDSLCRVLGRYRLLARHVHAQSI